MEQLGRDLARIRKEQNRELKDIQTATKIPLHILQSIEDDSIFSNLQDDPTYIRSFVRSYAKALSIDETSIIKALNKREKDDYKGSLQKFLDEKPKSTFSFDDQSGEQETEEENGMIHDHSPQYKSDESQEEPQKTSEPQKESSSKKDVNSIDWSKRGQQSQPMASTKLRAWIGILAIVVVVALAVYFFFFNGNELTNQNNQSEADQQKAETTTKLTTDTLQLNIVPSAATDSMQRMSHPSAAPDSTLSELPDTLTMIVYAANDKLDPVRVTSDLMDDINPYWIEKGRAYRFNFMNSISIRGPYSQMELILNGRPIKNIRSNFYNSDTRLLEIKRSFFAGDSTWLQPPPDSVTVNIPPPDSVQNRPTFDNQ